MEPDYGYFEEKKLGKPYDVKLLKRLYPFTQPYRLLLFGSIGLVLLITVLDLALPYVTKVAIDRYIVPQMDRQSAVDKKFGDDSRSRVIRVNLSNPQHQALVNKYSTLFKIDGKTIPDNPAVAVFRKNRLLLHKGLKHILHTPKKVFALRYKTF